MEIFWLEQVVSGVPAETDWLSPAERAQFGSLRVPKRREDWRLGRWTAKQAIAAYLDRSGPASMLAAIEIRVAESGAPEAFVDERPAPVSISISHREGRALCTVAPAGLTHGCDLEVVEPRSDAFVRDYFTAEEQCLIDKAEDAQRFRLLALLWSAKESTLKTLRTGLRLDPVDIAVTLHETAAAPIQDDNSSLEVWLPMQTRYAGQSFQGWWNATGNIIRTIVSIAPTSIPRRVAIDAARAVLPCLM